MAEISSNGLMSLPDRLKDTKDLTKKHVDGTKLFRKQLDEKSEEYAKKYQPFCAPAAWRAFRLLQKKKFEQDPGLGDEELVVVENFDFKPFGDVNNFVESEEGHKDAFSFVRGSMGKEKVKIGEYRLYFWKDGGYRHSVFIPNEELEKEKVKK